MSDPISDLQARRNRILQHIAGFGDMHHGQPPAPASLSEASLADALQTIAANLKLYASGSELCPTTACRTPRHASSATIAMPFCGGAIGLGRRKPPWVRPCLRAHTLPPQL